MDNSQFRALAQRIARPEPGQKRLLSLDGGGIRGLSSLIILKRLMEEVAAVLSKTDEQQQSSSTAGAHSQAASNSKTLPKPCEYFDLIGGTSTGGIIALMLGPLQMSVEDAIGNYQEFSEQVFGKKKWWLTDGKYMAKRLKDAIDKTVKKCAKGPGDTKLRNEGTKTFVCARNADQNNLVMMCSYDATHHTQWHYRDQPGDKGLEIWEAARATSAAPTFFKPITLNDVSFVDGGLGYNNPAFEVLYEGEELFDFSIPGSPDRLACLVSIGTGEAEVVTAYNWKRSLVQRVIPTQMIRALISIVTDCDSTHERLARRFRNCPDRYFRLNVSDGLQNIGLDQWKRLDDVAKATRAYLEKMLRE